MDNDIARIIGGLYIAILAGLPQESAQTANDILFQFAEHPDIRPDDQRIYRSIALSILEPEDAAEYCRERQIETPRPYLEAIQGGSAA
jgi:hypothetical protein